MYSILGLLIHHMTVIFSRYALPEGLRLPVEEAFPESDGFPFERISLKGFNLVVLSLLIDNLD